MTDPARPLAHQDHDGRLFDLPEVQPPELPEAVRDRFVPLRAGIFNLWQYDQQEFRFHQGRLLLRGENGTGKSKALELLLPFLLDADLSPNRLDPFAGTARTMYWNLLEGDRHESRVGYVWLELGRRPDGGDPIYWTLGCGLRATRRTRRVDSWYFVAPRRVGADLVLIDRDRRPLLESELTRELTNDGAVFSTGKEYRERLDQLFYSLGDDRFAALRHLLLQLRRPQLSQKLDPASLSELLTESLPPIDTGLIGQLSESFERLEEDQRELTRVDARVGLLERFLEVYREYARGAVRARAAEVRQADSRYHKTASELRDAQGMQQELDRRLEELAERREDLHRRVERSRATLGALEQSDAMRSAESLRAQRQHADDLEGRAHEAEEDRARAEAGAGDAARERDAAGREAEEAVGLRDERLREAEVAAGDAALPAAHAAAADALAEDPKTAETTARAAVRTRREAITEVQGLAADRDRTRQHWNRREERRQDAEAELRGANERSRAAERAVGAEEERLGEALGAWSTGLTELVLDEAGLDHLREAAVGETADAPAGTREGWNAALARLAAPVREARTGELAQLDAENRLLSADRREAAAERDRVEAAREVPPEPPPTRAAERGGRPGAPLYRLVDFRPDLPQAERAGLEAALEASGLLDAWVTPQGALLDPGTLDTVLVPEAEDLPEGTPSLASALRVEEPGGRTGERAGESGREGPDVAPDVVDSLLASIALLPAGAEDPAVRMGTDGTWRLGPLRGTWTKEGPEHVGAAARAAARQRRLEELDLRLADFDRQLEQTATAREAVRGRLARLEEELERAPSTEALRRARARLGAAVEEEERLRRALAAAEESASRARGELDAAERRLASRARDLELTPFLADLPGLLDRVRDYELALSRAVAAWRTATAARQRAASAADRASEAETRARELGRRAAEAGRRAASARAGYETLEATVGREAREVLDEHRREKERLGALEQGREELAAEREQVSGERGGAEARVRLKTDELAERDEDRQHAVERFRHLEAAGLLPLALGEPPAGAPEIPEQREGEGEGEPTSGVAPSWTAALELARELERVTSDVDLAQEAADRRAQRLHGRFQELSTDLGADFRPTLYPEEELSVIRVYHNGAEHELAALLKLQHDEAEARRGALADHERETLRRFLLGDVGTHLRSRLQRAKELVEEMNKKLEEARTSSGIVLRLAWRSAGDAAPEVRRAVELLQKDLHLLAERERQELESFFMDRINESRQRWEAVPWLEHLLGALDYRLWHRFAVQRRTDQDDGWQELTRHGHAAASGGEKAVALHLPLFAAASAHYESARKEAPRLVMLDEAFAGIDQGMRGRCMKLLVDFDLDFMMTSHDEWGCYEELPGLAVYQLYRDPGIDGVGAVRFVWSGGRLREEGPA